MLCAVNDICTPPTNEGFSESSNARPADAEIRRHQGIYGKRLPLARRRIGAPSYWCLWRRPGYHSRGSRPSKRASSKSSKRRVQQRGPGQREKLALVRRPGRRSAAAGSLLGVDGSRRTWFAWPRCSSPRSVPDLPPAWSFWACSRRPPSGQQRGRLGRSRSGRSDGDVLARFRSLECGVKRSAGPGKGFTANARAGSWKLTIRVYRFRGYHRYLIDYGAEGNADFFATRGPGPTATSRSRKPDLSRN